MSSTGKVYLVGAGPGDPGLLTVRAWELIRRAQVIVYDRLVGKRIINQGKTEAEKIYVGKESGRHTLPQQEINRLLVAKAREGKMVVRLKGGDPFCSAGGEEAEYLRRNGVDFEIVPGVTSAIAAPAYAGILVTHRDFNSTLTIITGHERRINWRIRFPGTRWRPDMERWFPDGNGEPSPYCGKLLAGAFTRYPGGSGAMGNSAPTGGPGGDSGKRGGRGSHPRIPAACSYCSRGSSQAAAGIGLV